MFSDFENAESIGLSGCVLTSDVRDMSYMFIWRSGLTELDVSGFDTSKVTDMSRIFYNCVNLIDLDTSDFVISLGTNTECMTSD